MICPFINIPSLFFCLSNYNVPHVNMNFLFENVFEYCLTHFILLVSDELDLDELDFLNLSISGSAF